ncbi:MAG: carbohydrate ABC transporter permease [Lachnospiraceae bacterium]|nr:carbohydrate ABC transporter permease [Lachnospiraceae bacterium]
MKRSNEQANVETQLNIHSTKIKKGASGITFDIIKYTLLTLLSVICVLPFILIISGSFSDNPTVLKTGYGILPKGFNLDAYSFIFKNPKGILQAYKMTGYYTVVGTLVGLAVTVLTAYVISRKTFKYRNVVSFLIYFTTIFGGAMVPWYLMYTSVLPLRGTTFIIWFPAILGSFNVILMRTFITGSVPDAIIESAKIDGAGEGTILTRIVLPVLKPGLATVGLFLALGYWNDWYRSSMFATDKKNWELQLYLYELVNKANAMKELVNTGVVLNDQMPTQTVKMAMAVVVTGPILLLYPFVQRYFISGITVGAVKG